MSPELNAATPIEGSSPLDVPINPPSSKSSTPPKVDQSRRLASTPSSTTLASAHDDGLQDGEGNAAARVERKGTKGSVVVAPYTIHSNKVRWMIVVIVASAGFISPFSANVYFPVIPAVAEDLRTTVEKINISVTVFMIFQGISPSIFGAICDVLGRRPVYILTMIIYMGACAGLANTHSYGALLGLRILQAVGSASVIAVGSGSIGDIAPPSERGKFMAIFGLGPMLGPCVGPVAGGLLADAYGWQSLFWLCFAIGAFVLIAIALFLPETLRSLVGNGSVPARGVNRSLISIWQERRRSDDSDAISIATVDKPPKKTWKDVRPFAPLQMFREKDVLAVLTFNSATYSLFYAVTASTGSVFKTTYGLNETELGLCFIANGAGCLIASFVNAPRMTADYKLVERRMEAKKKEMKSEETLNTKVDRKRDLNDLSSFPIEQARLRSLPYYFAALTCATIAYGWFVDKRLHLSAPLIMQFIIGLTVTSMFNMATTLMVDLYPGQSASATAANNLYRCLCGAAATAFIDPLLNKMGIGWAFTFLTLLNCCFLPLIWLELRFGMRWRAERAARVLATKERSIEKKEVKERTKEKTSA